MGADPRVAACSSTVHLPDFRCIFDKRHDPHLMDVLKSKWGGGAGERGETLKWDCLSLFPIAMPQINNLSSKVSASGQAAGKMVQIKTR